MKLPRDVTALLTRRFDSKHREWLAIAAGEAWPMSIPLGAPSEQQAMREIDAVRSWVEAWRHWPGAGDVEWTTRQWKVLGAQRLPTALTLHHAADLARCIGQIDRWTRAESRFACLAARWPQLQGRLPRLFGVLADYGDDDFQRLQDMLGWLEAHPSSGLYPRQIPVPGLDSKWLDSRTGMLGELVTWIRPSATADFYALCGLRKKPVQMRIRLLDPELRAVTGGLGDLTCPVAELASLQLHPAHVLIVENLQTGLALPDMKGTVVIMALGYSVDLIALLPWVKQARTFYWGDIDSHGFAILNRARSTLPALQSILMDEATLTDHMHLWTEEGVQHAATSLPLLTKSEASVYAGLKSNIWAQRVRLEQERIGWERAICSVSAAMSATLYTQSPQAPVVCLNQKFDQTPQRPASPEGH